MVDVQISIFMSSLMTFCACWPQSRGGINSARNNIKVHLVAVLTVLRKMDI